MSDPTPLEGENIETQHWEDARHWISIYDDLIRFKRSVLARAMTELQRLEPVAQLAIDADIRFIEAQMAGYQERLELWYGRAWQLHGLWLEPDGRLVRHKGREAALSVREFELLHFLLEHPHRVYTTTQIASYAWSDAALLPEEVRNYVTRVRRILARLEIPCELINKPAHGYTLIFRNIE